METVNNTPKKKVNPAKVKDIILNSIIYILLIIWALSVLFPFYYMIMTSFKETAAYNNEVTPQIFATKITFENYFIAWTRTDISLGKEMLNTLLYSVLTTAIMIVVTILAAFAFARLQFKGKNIVFTMFLAMMMIPQELVIITNYHTADEAGWLNSYTGLIIPSVLSVFYIYLLRQTFMQVPDSLYYAAKVDGTSDFKYLTHILIPIAKPTIISIVILKLIECWNAYVWPRAINDMEKYKVVSQGIIAIRTSGLGKGDIPQMMAAVASISAPLLIIFIIFRKQIMSGVSKAGTKG